MAKLCSEQIVVHLPELRVGKVVPRTGIAIQHRGSLGKLLAVSAALALVRVVRVAPRVRVKLEELSKIILGKVPGTGSSPTEVSPFSLTNASAPGATR